MAQTSCIECGYPFNGTETSCPECGSPIQSKNPTPRTPRTIVITDEGDNEAENILRRWLKWVRILIIVISVIIGLLVFYRGFVAAATVTVGTGWVVVEGIIAGATVIFFGYVLAWLIWCVGMIFINISTNVRTIKRKLLSK